MTARTLLKLKLPSNRASSSAAPTGVTIDASKPLRVSVTLLAYTDAILLLGL